MRCRVLDGHRAHRHPGGRRGAQALDHGGRRRRESARVEHCGFASVSAGAAESARPPSSLPVPCAVQSALWAFLAFLLWTCTFGTNLALNLLLLMVTILLGLEAACPSHPHLYKARGSRLVGAPLHGVGPPPLLPWLFTAGTSSAATARHPTRGSPPLHHDRRALAFSALPPRSWLSTWAPPASMWRCMEGYARRLALLEG